jgi:hypothetical protein
MLTYVISLSLSQSFMPRIPAAWAFHTATALFDERLQITTQPSLSAEARYAFDAKKWRA